MNRLGHVAALALLLLLASSGPAVAQHPLVPTETLAQEQPQPPETLPQDEDDEELGEEIPDEEEQEPDEPEGGSGGGGGGSPTTPADPPPVQQAQQLPRTGGDPLPLVALAALLLASGLALRAAAREPAR